LRALLRDGTLAGAWTLDGARSEVQLNAKHAWGLLGVSGTFRQVEGTGAVSVAGKVAGLVRVAAASVDTGNATRDKHLRSAEFFDADVYPDIAFIAEGATIVDDGQDVHIQGNLTIHGTTRACTFQAQASATPGEVRLDGRVRVNRADFGLTANKLGMVSWHSDIVIHAVFTRAEGAPPPAGT
jgi:polyisoprenoid-binding protein YceI